MWMQEKGSESSYSGKSTGSGRAEGAGRKRVPGPDCGGPVSPRAGVYSSASEAGMQPELCSQRTSYCSEKKCGWGKEEMRNLYTKLVQVKKRGFTMKS